METISDSQTDPDMREPTGREKLIDTGKSLALLSASYLGMINLDEVPNDMQLLKFSVALIFFWGLLVGSVGLVSTDAPKPRSAWD